MITGSKYLVFVILPPCFVFEEKTDINFPKPTHGGSSTTMSLRLIFHMFNFLIV